MRRGNDFQTLSAAVKLAQETHLCLGKVPWSVCTAEAPLGSCLTYSQEIHGDEDIESTKKPTMHHSE